MHDATSKSRLRVLSSGVVALIALSIFCIVWVGEPPPTPTPPALPQHRSDPTSTIGEAAAEKTMRSSPTVLATFRVVNDSGSPLAKAELFALAESLRVGDPAHRQDTLARTDANGISTVDAAALAGVTCVAVVAAGFIPGTVDDVVPGRAYTVVLTRAAAIDFHVVDLHDQPVSGFTIALTRGPADRQERERYIDSTEDFEHVVTRHGSYSRARTDADGNARIFAAPGKHQPIFNTRDGAYHVTNLRELLPTNAPGAYRVVVARPVACVVRFSGDPVIAIRWSPRGIRVAGDHDNSVIRSRAHDLLLKLFPEAEVVCEMPSVHDAKPSFPRACAFLFSRTSGWAKQEFDLVPFDTIRETRNVSIATGSRPLSARLTVLVRNPDGEDLRLEHGQLMFVADCLGTPVSFDLTSSVEQEVPAGALDVVQGPAGLPTGVLSQQSITLAPGEVATLVITMQEPLHRGRLVFRTKSGGEPVQGSVTYGDGDRTRTQLLATSTSVEGWFAGKELQYKAYFSKVEYSGVLRIDPSRPCNETQEWIVEVGHE